MRILGLATGVVLVVVFAAGAMAGEVLRAYGPGGPLPAMKEAAAEFGKLYNVAVEVTAGPTGNWLNKAKEDADAHL